MPTDRAIPDLDHAKHGVYVCPNCEHIERTPGECPACRRRAEGKSGAVSRHARLEHALSSLCVTPTAIEYAALLALAEPEGR